MQRLLHLHPQSTCSPVEKIEVHISRDGLNQLNLQYVVTGNIANIRLPAATAPSRGDRLWEQTCFEVFLRAPHQTSYYEFNFSPSTQWAAYAFLGYRLIESNVEDVKITKIDSSLRTQSYQLTALANLGASANLKSNTSWQLGLSAVIEETDGNKSYWALAHPPGKPDFHHSDCFALELGAEEQT